MDPVGRVAAVWRGDPSTPVAETRNHSRLAPIFDALRTAGVEIEPVLYSDALADDVIGQLSRFDGVLVFVDPITADGDRTVLDAALREVASRGTWVSAHPDTILKMGTKEVLYRTRSLGWGADVRMYSTVEEFRELFPPHLASDRVRVLKQNRGNGGIGVWKVSALDSAAHRVRVQHAARRDDVTEELTLTEFMDRCVAYLDSPGKLIDQPFATRISEGMLRAYVVEHEVVGFASQQPVSREVDTSAPAPSRVLGLPAAKTMYAADEPEFAELRTRLERDWVPGLCRLVEVSEGELPVLWDADFLYGRRTDTGADTYLLCEINVSSVIPFPDTVPAKVASAVQRRIRGQLRTEIA